MGSRRRAFVVVALVVAACAAQPQPKVFRITPQRPVEELRREALAATPPVETGKLPGRPRRAGDARPHDPPRRPLRTRATTSSRRRVYTQARAFMQRPAAEALVAASAELHEHGWGVLVHDALSALVRHQGLLGGDARRQARLRRRPGGGLEAQPRLRRRHDALRPEDRQAGRDAEPLRRDEPARRRRLHRAARRRSASAATCCGAAWSRTASRCTPTSGGTSTTATGSSTRSSTCRSNSWGARRRKRWGSRWRPGATPVEPATANAGAAAGRPRPQRSDPRRH